MLSMGRPVFLAAVCQAGWTLCLGPVILVCPTGAPQRQCAHSGLCASPPEGRDADGGGCQGLLST